MTEESAAALAAERARADRAVAHPRAGGPAGGARRCQSSSRRPRRRRARRRRARAHTKFAESRHSRSRLAACLTSSRPGEARVSPAQPARRHASGALRLRGLERRVHDGQLRHQDQADRRVVRRRRPRRWAGAAETRRLPRRDAWCRRGGQAAGPGLKPLADFQTVLDENNEKLMAKGGNESRL